MIRFFVLTIICTISMFTTFTLAFCKKSLSKDSWNEFGWPLTFVKQFSENDFYIGTHYFYVGNLVLDIIFCFSVSFVSILLMYLIRYFASQKSFNVE
jgi:ABC-type glycerol-3-phosphate transport system permease component